MLNNSSSNFVTQKSTILGVFTGKPGEPNEIIKNGKYIKEITTTYYYPNDQISVIAKIISDGASIHRKIESNMIIFDEKNSLYYFVGIHQNGNLSLKTDMFSAVDVPNLLKRADNQQANKIIEKVYDAVNNSSDSKSSTDSANTAKFISDPNDPRAQEILSRVKFLVKSAGVFELNYSSPKTTDISDNQPARTAEPLATSRIQPAIPPVQPARTAEPSTTTSTNILSTRSIQQPEHKKGCCNIS